MDNTSEQTDYRKVLPNVIREGITAEELRTEYNKWAPSYEEDLVKLGYEAYEPTVDQLFQLLPTESSDIKDLVTEDDLEKLGYEAYEPTADGLCRLFAAESRTNVRILDIGAGTGLLGSKLKQAGFTHVDALEPASQMLKEAKKRGIYEHYIVEYLTEKPLPGIAAGTYDAVVGVGMMGYSLVPYTAIHEMIRLTKQGGYIILSIRESVLAFAEYRDMEPTMDRLEKEGHWKRVGRTIYPNYFKDCGYVILSIKESVPTYAEYREMEPTMERLVKEGGWKSLGRTVYPKFFKDSNGILYVFQVL